MSFNCTAQYGMKLVERFAAHQEQPNDVLKRAGYEEVLLCQPQLFTGFRFVIRIKNLGDGFRYDLLVHRAVVIADIERLEIERFSGLSLPQAQ